MIELHLCLKVKPGQEAALEKTYANTFVPAISRQKGFVHIKLLRHQQRRDQYEIHFAFRTPEERAIWAVSADHEVAFPAIRALCTEISGQLYDVVAEGAG